MADFFSFNRSKTGLVSTYGEDANISSLSSSPRTLKTLQNLTTSISTLRFNHDSQLLAIASNVKKDQMRLVSLHTSVMLSVILMLSTSRSIFHL